MELIVAADGTARWGGRTLRCALGRAGISSGKREGDGATPVGIWPIREVLFRADRVTLATALPHAPLKRDDGWCDDPTDPDYNKKVTLPHRARCESLWRDDGVYDLITVLGYNDAPVAPGAGSAIFLHVARDDFSPTQGCVALARDDLLAVLREAKPGDAVRVSAAAAARHA
jgi:L,D-peptidoglycan transpeptidase YkuD (ErfK/YbiS/YcfS/YnhG family)